MGYLWMTDEVGAQFFRDISRVEYTQENVQRNDFRSRDSWEMRLFDAWGHCFMGAAATRDIGESSTWVFGVGHEVLHEGLSWLTLGIVGHDSLIQDTFNQAVGRAIGTRHRTGDLARLSYDAMIEGRLDLTLAAIPRGTHLRTSLPARPSSGPAVRLRLLQWRQRRA